MTKHDQFRSDMLEAGYDIREYAGRFGWKGPAVVVEKSELQDVIRATAIKLQTDSMGLSIVVYPVSRS